MTEITAVAGLAVLVLGIFPYDRPEQVNGRFRRLRWINVASGWPP